MIKNFLLTFFVSLTALNVSGQNFGFGGKAGINFANTTEDNANGKMRTGLHLGLVVEIPVLERLSFAPEVLYSSQGTKEELYSFTGDHLGDAVLKRDYLQIPLMFRYYIIKGLNLEAGPQFGFLTSAKNVFEDESGNIKELYSSFDYGMNVGVGYKFFSNLFLQARYNLGLSDIYKDEGNEMVGTTREANNAVIQASVGFMF